MKTWKSFLQASVGLLLLSMIAFSVLAPNAYAQTGRVNLYKVTASNLGWTSIVGQSGTVEFGTTPTGYGWRGIVYTFSMPFAFNYDATTVAAGTTVYANGARIGFGTSAGAYQTYGGLESSSDPGVLYPFGEYYFSMGGAGFDGNYNWGTAGYGCYYQVSGTSPNQVLTIEMEGCHSPGAGIFDGYNACGIQVKIYQATNVIQFIYQSHSYTVNPDDYVSGGGVGLNGFTSPSFQYLAYSLGLTATPSTDLTFTPPAPPQELSLTPNPKTLNFGTTNPQNPITMSCTAKNVCPSGTTLTINSATLVGSSEFSQTGVIPPAGTKLAAGQSVQYFFTFLPFTNGTATAQFTVSTNGVDSGTQTMNLTAIGAVPAVSYSSKSMFLGVNTEVTDTSNVQYLYINSVGGGPLVVNSINFVGIDGGKAYFITHYPQSTIPVGGVDSIGVRFDPDIEGQPDAHMVINTTAVNNPSDTVTMDGHGILMHLAIDSAKSYPLPTTVNFDSVKLGVDSCLTIQLWNPGSDTLAIEQNYFESGDPDYTLNGLSGPDTLIPPGGTQNIQVCFQPIQQGTRVATIRIRTNIPHTLTVPQADTSTFRVNIVGIGVPTGKLAISGPATNGTVPVGGPAGCVIDTFWNTGDAALTINSVTITGANASDFSPTFTPSLPITIAGNQKVLFKMCADPSDTGAESALLTATGTSNETPTIATLGLAVYGVSTNDSAVITQEFHSTSCGPDTEIVTVMNKGNQLESFLGSVTGTNGADFVLSPTTSQNVAPGGTATFTIVFTPTLTTMETASLLISTSDKQIPLIPLSATGGAAVIVGSGTAPTTQVGTTSAPFAVTITNNGTCPWTPGTGAKSSDAAFTYVSGGTTAIAPGGTAVDSFTYSPTESGTNNATVSFPNQVGKASSINVTINGTASSEGVNPITASNGYSLDQNYPNPFNGSSDVEITLPVGGQVNLSIINVQGQVVQTVLNQHFDAGTFDVTLHSESLASGTYYYQMTAGGVTLTRQMVVIK